VTGAEVDAGELYVYGATATAGAVFVVGGKTDVAAYGSCCRPGMEDEL
jgi:hypothetical protein